MQLEYDLDTGALYINLSDAEIARTREAGDNAAVDLDAAGGVVGIEVISIAHPWPLADILDAYRIPAGEEAQIRAYFGLAVQGTPPRRLESPTLSIAAPAPAAVSAAA